MFYEIFGLGSLADLELISQVHLDAILAIPGMGENTQVALFFPVEVRQ